MFPSRPHGVNVKQQKRANIQPFIWPSKERVEFPSCKQLLAYISTLSPGNKNYKMSLVLLTMALNDHKHNKLGFPLIKEAAEPILWYITDDDFRKQIPKTRTFAAVWLNNAPATSSETLLQTYQSLRNADFGSDKKGA